MRNLKRALSLALASVMLLGMMVVGTSAASFPDVDDNNNVEAIEVLNAVGVMIGDNGNFKPDQPVTRNEMAVIMAKLVLGTYEADSYVGTHPFTDVPSWADRYVAACYASGIVAGRSATTYDGQSTVTAVEAAAMMLRALGYEDLSKNADRWDQPVAAKANEVNLFTGMSGASNAAMNRDSVAKLALNTLKATMVTTVRDGQDIKLPDGTTISSNIRYNDRETSVYDYTNYDGNGVYNSNDEKLQLCEFLYGRDLLLKENATDDFGRSATKWKYDGDDVVTLADSATRTYTEEVKEQDIYKDLGLTGTDKAATVYTDGSGNTDSITLNRNDDVAIAGSGNGVLTQVYKDGETIKIVVVNTYLAQVSGDYDEDDEELTIGNVTGGGLTFNSGADTLSSDDFAGLADFEDEDYVLITAVLDAGGDVDEIKTIVKAETVTATVTGYTNNKNVTFDGSKHEYSANYEANGQDRNSYAIDEESVFIMDTYGYVIGLDEVAGSDDYVYVDSFDTNGSFRNSKDIADAYFPDGTHQTITLKKISQNNGTEITARTNGVLNDTAAGWYTYTVKNDEYTLTAVENDPKTVALHGKLSSGGTQAVTENGKVGITVTTDAGGNGTHHELNDVATARGNNKTVFVVLDDDDKITVYEGIKNVPDISINDVSSSTPGDAKVVRVAVSMDGSYANYVFIDASKDGAARIKGSTSSASDLIYILETTPDVGKDSSDNNIWVYDAIVNGTKTTVTANASSVFAGGLGLYNDVAYDNDGYVDDASLITGISDDNYKAYDFTASAFNAVSYKDGVLAVTNTTPSSSVDFIMADSFTIYTVDGTTVKTVTADKLAKDYEHGFNAASVRGDVWAVLNDDEEVTSLYVDIKGTSAGRQAVYTSAKLDAASNTASTDQVSVTINGKAYDVGETEDDVTKQTAAWVAAYNADANNTDWTASVQTGNAVRLTCKKLAADADHTSCSVCGSLTGGDTAGTASSAGHKADIAALGSASTTPGTNNCFTVTIGGKAYKVANSNTTVDAQLTAWAAKYNADPANTAWTAAPDTTADTVVFTKAVAGAVAPGTAPTGITGGTLTDAGADAQA